MVYLVAAVGQFFVILLSQIAVATGLILATTALAICILTAAAMVIHAALIHHRGMWQRIL